MRRNCFSDPVCREGAQVLKALLQNHRLRWGHANFVVQHHDRLPLRELFGAMTGPVLDEAGFKMHNCAWQTEPFRPAPEIRFEINWPVLEAVCSSFRNSVSNAA